MDAYDVFRRIVVYSINVVNTKFFGIDYIFMLGRIWMDPNLEAQMPMATNARKKAPDPKKALHAGPGKASLHVATQVREHKTREAILRAATRGSGRNGLPAGTTASLS